MCQYEDKNGNCEIANMPCEQVIICNQETVYIDKAKGEEC